jgi:hypothetical protein
MVNANGQPNEEYLTALENYVQSLRRASDDQYQQILARLRREYPAQTDRLGSLSIRAEILSGWRPNACASFPVHLALRTLVRSEIENTLLVSWESCLVESSNWRKTFIASALVRETSESASPKMLSDSFGN